LDFATITLLQSKVVRLTSNPNLKDQVPVSMSPSERVAQLYPEALGSLFIAFYDSQGYGESTVTHLHTETSFLLVPNILISILLSNTFSLCDKLNTNWL
jgi:hypothetical protein